MIRNAVRALIWLLMILASVSALAEGLGPDASGRLPPVSQPPFPKVIPGYTELDPDTGLHITGTPIRVDLATYSLKVAGKVDRPLSLSFDDIRRLPRLSSRPTLVCEGYFEDVATWAGASLSALLDRAGVQASARGIELVCADGYKQQLSLAQARSPDAYLAYELEGKILPVLHGFPLRAVLPSQSGFNWAKWIVEVRAL
jgi:DMSO/TMAO reductase YedYZ molybdopterin-dependent catalytic subunit